MRKRKKSKKEENRCREHTMCFDGSIEAGRHEKRQGSTANSICHLSVKEPDRFFYNMKRIKQSLNKCSLLYTPTDCVFLF